MAARLHRSIRGGSARLGRLTPPEPLQPRPAGLARHRPATTSKMAVDLRERGLRRRSTVGRGSWGRGCADPLIIRRSWVQAPPAPPSLTCGFVHFGRQSTRPEGDLVRIWSAGAGLEVATCAGTRAVPPRPAKGVVRPPVTWSRAGRTNRHVVNGQVGRGLAT